MAQQLLDGTEVGPCVQQVRGEGVAQGVGRNFSGDGGSLQRLVEKAPHAAHVQPGAPEVEKDRLLAHARARLQSAPAAQVLPHGLYCLGAHRHHALLPSFPPDPHHPLAQIQVIEIQRREFGDAHPGGVEQLQDGPVPGSQGRGVIGHLQQMAHLDHAEQPREPVLLLGGGHAQGGIRGNLSVALEIPEEGAQGRQLARRRRALHLAAVELPQERAYRQTVHLARVDSALRSHLLLQKGGELPQVGGVGTNGLGRAVLVELQVSQIGSDRWFQRCLGARQRGEEVAQMDLTEMVPSHLDAGHVRGQCR